MGRSPLSIDVPKRDQQELRALLKGGVQQVRVVLRALALLQLAERASAPQIAKVIPLPKSSQSTSALPFGHLMTDVLMASCIPARGPVAESASFSSWVSPTPSDIWCRRQDPGIRRLLDPPDSGHDGAPQDS
jgi:hypothetical protein